MREYMSTREVAALVGYTPNAIGALVRKDVLPAVRLDRNRLGISRDDAESLARSVCSGSRRRGYGRSAGTRWTGAHQLMQRQTDECVMYPFKPAADGYPVMTYRYKAFRVHRYVCRVVHGEPPSADHEAAHSCGVPMCINPQHLRWATRLENEADKVTHGTSERWWLPRSGPPRIAAVVVSEIKARIRAGETMTGIAAATGVSVSHVRNIRDGRTAIWRDLP